jgi:ABC-type Zn uptake system ZnuABC Zn-binding protein ZnuA
MNKPYEDMDDDEKIKFTEFEAKEQLLKEEREKIRKNLELELRKLRNEIKEICEKYDDKLFVLYRKRLEYDYRLYEQELYIVKLTLSMLIENDNVNRRE